MRKNKSGNILFLILIAVALFAALSYAVTGSNRTTGNTVESEKAKLSQGEIDSYLASVETGKNRLLLINGCASINYTPPADQVAADRSCHIFHPDGAGVPYRNFGYGAGCNLTSLALGEWCNGVAYAGTSGGNRIYTTLSDLGDLKWAQSSTVNVPADSMDDGLANTNTLIGLVNADAPYDAAIACRALGEEWYLPALNELGNIYPNKDAGALANTFAPNQYWSSTENGTGNARWFSFANGTNSHTSKGLLRKVRCVRRD